LATLKWSAEASAGSALAPLTLTLTIAREPVFVTVTSPLRTLFGFMSVASMIVSSGDTVSDAVPAVTLLAADFVSSVKTAPESTIANTATAAITPPASSRSIVLLLLVNAGGRAFVGASRDAIMNRLSSASC
jgi:hypothetical protein